MTLEFLQPTNFAQFFGIAIPWRDGAEGYSMFSSMTLLLLRCRYPAFKNPLSEL